MVSEPAGPRPHHHRAELHLDLLEIPLELRTGQVQVRAAAVQRELPVSEQPEMHHSAGV